MFDTIPGVTFQVFISCTSPMLPYIAKFASPFIPSHPIIFSKQKDFLYHLIEYEIVFNNI
jgi:hypothetical protein